LVGLIGFTSVGKTCAFLGNDYDKILGMKCGHRTPPGLKAQIREQAVNLIENEDVDTFLVGEKGGYEIDAYDVVLDLQKEYPHIRIIFVISNITDLHEMGGNASYVAQRRGFDDFIYPPKCELGYKRLGIVYRNRYIIENTDFIIAYNKREGKAYEFCKSAKGKGVKVIELAER
jgi:uncharacterized phage-like protein YoqJ